MKGIAGVFLVALLATLGGCAVALPNRDVEASAWAANYTEDYIYDYRIQTVSGKRTGVGGGNVAEFSRGGTAGIECCGRMPGVGQTVKVVWQVGGRQEDRSEWKTYSRDVVVTGTMPRGSRHHSRLVVRFFPNHEIEAELFPYGELDPKNPRVDKLFSGERVMRHKGE
ncbi:hypothetical protein D3C87_1533570 [compost metagenome]|uniref:DUF3304 domain-containing protein n=2 Tax=Cupriavidus campinensis TaxID=151783 RepID=A0AAE9L2H0_9BURK|nr:MULTISPECIES: DUF3304 domain-containing protein [Cupriavidus]TSP12875.1 DUF3304 domain-containing protein [Cupriavidus campinensis]URF04661.1 DUF3304 domain-containing protein [Cupriavidus campinensis]